MKDYYNFVFILIFLFTSKLVNSKIYVEEPEEYNYKEYLESISNKKFSKKYKNKEYINDNNDFTRKPTSSLIFYIKVFCID